MQRRGMAESNEEEQAERGGSRAAGLVIAGLIGSVIGAAVALLLSPWRGHEAREKVKQGASAVCGAAKKMVGAFPRMRERGGAQEEREAGEHGPPGPPPSPPAP